MPKYTDPSTGKTFTSQVDLTPDELEEAFGAVGGTAQSASTPKASPTDYASDVNVADVPEWARNHPEVAGAVYGLKKALSPVAEALGLIGGGIAGTPAGPIGTAAGAGMGYAGAKRVEQIANQSLGVTKPETAKEAFVNTGADLATGTASQAIGPVAGKALSAYPFVICPYSGTALTMEFLTSFLRDATNARACPDSDQKSSSSLLRPSIPRAVLSPG